MRRRSDIEGESVLHRLQSNLSPLKAARAATPSPAIAAASSTGRIGVVVKRSHGTNTDSEKNDDSALKTGSTKIKNRQYGDTRSSASQRSTSGAKRMFV